MILIADAGGTKTDWRLIDGEEITQLKTRGFNPNTHEIQDFIEGIEPTFESVASQIDKLYFYGASLYPESQDFKSAMGQVFTNTQIDVNNDLLGSCRSLSADEPAFVGILGTGAAGCYYDGIKVVNHPPSMGYSLGDEGSGALLGRRLLNLGLRKRLESSVQRLFDEEFQLTKEIAYRNVYKGDAPNAYLASFTKFLLKNKDNAQIHKLITAEFENHFDAFFMDMEDIYKYPFHFTGSVAFYFGDFLREIGVKQKLTIGRIVQSPIAGLALYHQSHE